MGQIHSAREGQGRHAQHRPEAGNTFYKLQEFFVAEVESRSGNGAIYAYAHGYQDPFNSFRTVMAYKCSGGYTRVDHFSNPDILYRGEPTGTVNSSNNALTLNNTAATVAGFRQQVEQTLPAAPSELQATAASDSEIELNRLDNAADESGFTVQRSENDRDFVQIASLPANTTRYLDNNLNADTLYYYRVRSYNSAGNSGYSNTAIVATDPTPLPSKPSGLTATAGGTDSITINWTDTSDNEADFSVQRHLDGSFQWVQIGTTGPNTASYTDTGLQAGTLYYYRVAAYNDSGQSGNSNSDSARTDEQPVSKYLRQQDWLL